MQACITQSPIVGVRLAETPLNEKAGFRIPWSGIKDCALVLCAVVSTLVAVLVYRAATAAANQKQEVETLNDTIDKRVSDTINPKLGQIQDKLDKIDKRLSMVEGWKDAVDHKVNMIGQSQADLRNKVAQQLAVTRLQDPARVLATIRAEIGIHESSRQEVSKSDLTDYKNALHGLESSTYGYWQTVAAIINYQSLLNQMSGEAPDPNAVSRPCMTVKYSTFVRSQMSGCIVDLDTNTFEDVVFKNTVVRYHGGPVRLRNVTFVNCRFVMEVKAFSAPPPPNSSRLLIAILDSPDSAKVRVE